MPKLKPSKFEESRRVVRSCITGNMELYGVKNKDLAARTDRGLSTISYRLRNPETYTLGDLWAMQTVLKLTPMQAASLILGKQITAKDIQEYLC